MSLDPPALDRALAVATEAVQHAGAVALAYYTGRFDVTLKPDQTPVTQADREAEQVIVEALRRAFPQWGVLGEEFGAQGPTDVRWIIDPIDGTRNFVRHIPVWATLLALEEHGEIVAGVIHNPVSAELYTARRGGGTRKNGERVRVSDIGDMWGATLLHAGLRLYKGAGLWDGLGRLVDATERQRGFGDYMGYTLVAEGKAELYVEVDLKPWDLAPCKIVVEEAGGRFTDVAGRPTIYSGNAVVSNGRLHDAALKLLHGE
jgi:histidinol-phosphatase